MQRYKSKYTGPQIDVALERALPGGEIDQSTSAKLDWEGLINPEFTVAQAGIGGNHGSVPYAADCWKLVSGTVSAAPGGGLVLNGTIRQTLETAAGLDAVASINATSGTATYDDATRQFDITSSGGTIKRAHLGLRAITDWAEMPMMERGTELEECQKYFLTNNAIFVLGAMYSSTNGIFTVFTPKTMREVPVLDTVAATIIAYDGSTAVATLEVLRISSGAIVLKATVPSGGKAGLACIQDFSASFIADL